MSKRDNLPEKKGTKPVSKQALYSKASSHALEAIEVLVREMQHGDNSNARTGAARALLNKCVPDLKSQELSGKDGEKLPFTIVIEK